jgi:peptidase E
MVLTLWQGAAESVERLSQADIVVSGGGSAANLMALWKMHGVDHVIRRMIAADSDVVLAGVSAGAACWFSGCDRRSLGLTVEVRTERTVQQTHTATPSSQIPESVS